jgi:hypothetical protein
VSKCKRNLRIDSGDNGSGDDVGVVDSTGSASMAEYYTSMLKNYDKTQLTRKIYSEQSEQLQDWIKRLWYR